MEPLKLDYHFDIVVPPSKITEADKAAFRRAFAERRKAPGHVAKAAAHNKAIEKKERLQAKRGTISDPR